MMKTLLILFSIIASQSVLSATLKMEGDLRYESLVINRYFPTDIKLKYRYRRGNLNVSKLTLKAPTHLSSTVEFRINEVSGVSSIEGVDAITFNLDVTGRFTSIAGGNNLYGTVTCVIDEDPHSSTTSSVEMPKDLELDSCGFDLSFRRNPRERALNSYFHALEGMVRK